MKGGIAMTALLIGFALSCWRLKLVAGDLGYRISAGDATAAASLGQLGGAVFFAVIGQTIARSAVLGRRGVPVAGAIVLTGYERLAAVIVSLGLATAGVAYLFGGMTWNAESGGAEFAKIVLGGIVAVSAGAFAAWGKPAIQLLRDVMVPGALFRIGRAILLSSAIQIATMTAYVAIASAVDASVRLNDIAAASTIVMLAASLPISFGGWGIRELSAVYVLGLIGFKNGDAVVVAVLVGTVALGIVAVVAAVSALGVMRRGTGATIAAPGGPQVDYLSMLAWGAPIAAVMAVFFQLWIPLTVSRLNVNLADPFAIIGAVAFATLLIRRGTPPLWRLSRLNAHVVVASLLLIGAFLHGWARFGWTDWAFVNRTIGWFMLLAYGATGAVIVTVGGERGLLILLRTFVAAGLAVVALDAAFFTIISAGITLPSQIVNYRLEGFAQNPNAFALQILLILSAAVAFRGARGHNLVISLAVLGLCLSQSRAGWLAFAAVVPAMLLLRAVKLSQLFFACAITALASVVLNWLPQIIDAVTGLLLPIGSGSSSPTVAPFIDAASRFGNSDTERMASLLGGWKLFLEYPIFGAGLGAFIHDYMQAHDGPLIIHATPLWLAAEMGIVGLVAFALPFLRIFVQEVGSRSDRSPVRAVLIVSLIAFGIMSLAHELLYQRALWVLLGAALACPLRRSDERPVVTP